MPAPNVDQPNEGIVGQISNTIANAANYVSETIQGNTAEASKEANKQKAKGNTADDSISNRVSGAMGAASDKLDQHSHEAQAKANKEKDRFARGSATFAAVTGIPTEAYLDGFKDSSPDFGRYVIEWVFGDVYSRTDLDLKTRELVIIAAGAALGATGIDVIKFHVPTAVRAGATRDQIFGVLTQVAIVAGVPTALAAISAAAQVLGPHSQVADGAKA